jgi:hypothetical protein
MQTIAQDLAETSRRASNPETRQIAWALLLQMAKDGDSEAWDEINNLSRTAKRLRNSTTGDILKNGRNEQCKHPRT